MSSKMRIRSSQQESRGREGGYIAVGVACVTSVLAAVALAGGGVPSPTKVNAQVVRATQASWTAKNDRFRTIGDLALDLCKPDEGLSVTVSLALSGGPAMVRVTAGGTGRNAKLLSPGVVPVSPGGSNSFTFVDEKRGHLDSRYYVQWRATESTDSTLEAGSVRALYKTSGPTGDCST